MREITNEYTLSYGGVKIPRDSKSLDAKIVYLGGYGKCDLVASQDNIKYSVQGVHKKDILDVGLDIHRPFTLKIRVRSPNTAFIDRGDVSAHWNGNGGNWHRGCPFFFRENGQSLDLIDLYKGGSVFLVLNGPSTADADLSLLSMPGVFTYGVNNGAHLIRPNFWSCVDDPTRFMESIWSDQTIQKFIPMSHFGKPIWDVDEQRLSTKRVCDFPNTVGIRRNERFDASNWLSESTINWGNHESLGGGRSVMLVALKVCYLLGFRTVYLVGCDFKMTESFGYFFKETRSQQAVRNNTNSYNIMRGYYAQLKPYFDAAGFSVYNTTADSGLDTFPFMDFKEAVSRTVSDLARLLTHDTSGMYVDRRKK